MKTFIKFFSIIILLVSFAACDVIDNPLKEGGTRPPVDSTVVVRKVIIEDFTGHRCKNCPYAAEKIHELQDVYGKNVIGIAIHEGPSNFTGTNADYPTDFTTDDGKTIYDFFKIPALPMGMVSRIDYTGTGTSHLKTYSGWPAISAGLLDSVAHIKLEALVGYESSTRTVTVDVAATALIDFSDDLKVVVMILESGIVSPQLMPDDTRNANYIHQHVLRKAFTQAMGDELALSPILTGAIHTKQIIGTVDAAWVADNCDIVVFVYNDRTKEILQAEQLALIP